jgi:hypothetical protein
MSRCGTCGQPHGAWKTIEQAVAILRERDGKPIREKFRGPSKFMRRLAFEGGHIVCTNKLTPEQVIEARESGRLFVLTDGVGFVIVPDGVSASDGETFSHAAPAIRMPLTLVDNEDRAGRIPGQPGYLGPGQ